MDGRLNGRVAVVTGAASGIGRATALRLAQEGARLALVDRDGAGLDRVRAEIEAAGTPAVTCASDVGLPGTADADAALVLSLWGRIDVLVCAAGYAIGGTVLTTRPEDWDAVLRTHVGGTWLWARAVLPAMQRQGKGSIVTVSSQLARAGGRDNSAYIAAKGALLSLTRTMALDFVSDGVRVNALVPGAIETAMTAASAARDPATAEARQAASLLRHPMHRRGRAEEVAEAALFLASDASSFTTGSEIVVDGGWLAG